MIVGSVGHVAAGGAWAAPPIVAVAVLLLGPVWVLSRRELTLAGIATLLASGQLITHTALMFGSAHTGGGMRAGSVFAFHLMAALLAGWWMRCGERRAWARARRGMAAVCRCVCHLLRGAPRAGANSAAAIVVPAVVTGSYRDRVALRHVIVLRGPPVPA
ncbi:MAG TPA: hypothetical protein VHC18_17000 [Amycolatopsis sp.]|nr:hypothetical protein [Amycolatopsis sp.]